MILLNQDSNSMYIFGWFDSPESLKDTALPEQVLGHSVFPTAQSAAAEDKGCCETGGSMTGEQH